MKKTVSDLTVVSLIGATAIAVFIGFGGTNRNYTMKTLGNNFAYTMRIDSTNTFSNSTGVIDASGYIASGYGRNLKQPITMIFCLRQMASITH